MINYPPLLPSSKPPVKNHMDYLGGALAHGVDQFLDHHVHALDAGPLQLYDLLLHDGLKRHVWGEKSSPETHQEEEERDIIVVKSGFPFQ